MLFPIFALNQNAIFALFDPLWFCKQRCPIRIIDIAYSIIFTSWKTQHHKKDICCTYKLFSIILLEKITHHLECTEGWYSPSSSPISVFHIPLSVYIDSHSAPKEFSSLYFLKDFLVETRAQWNVSWRFSVHVEFKGRECAHCRYFQNFKSPRMKTWHCGLFNFMLDPLLAGVLCDQLSLWFQAHCMSKHNCKTTS